MAARIDGRENDEIREMKVQRNYISHAPGSVFLEMGKTRILCTATIENKVPQFLRGKGVGWITAEYNMIPRSAPQRILRPQVTGKIAGRTHEIQRLIGRSLRAVVDLKKLGEKTIWLDCDVIEADGGTRCASITGSFIALYDCLRNMVDDQLIPEMPVTDFIAAVSVGIVEKKMLADLCFEEDRKAQVDMNVVMNSSGNLIEVQSTAEEKAFTKQEFLVMLDLSMTSIEKLISFQKKSLLKVS